ncbi:MAG: hypothetical protein ACI837_001095 [Crocinitomicaceae bacterium]|jgi:hypothetical protein
MKIVLTYTLILFAFSSNAGVFIPLIPYELRSSEQDATLSEFESVYEFDFSGVTDDIYTVLYSVDGIDGQTKLTPGSRLTICTKPGKHIFQFFTWHYTEIFTDTVIIKPHYRDVYQLNMSYSVSMMMMNKPVIYLYPELPTLVNVEIDIAGENPFYYPSYEDGWNCKALPNGEIQFGDKTYNYLFWDAQAVGTTLLHREGFIIQKDEVVPFLEKQLTTAGFTSKEQADFITYWAPRMIQNEQIFIQFMFNDACDEFAELKITPEPDNIYRIYMLWEPTETVFEVKEQVIESINREGFTVLEWGGMELPKLEKNEAL